MKKDKITKKSEAKDNPFAPKLSPKQRAAILTSFAGGATKHSLAKKYGVSVGTIKFHLKKSTS